MDWVATATTAVALLGGTGGIVGAALVFSQRRKIRADAADVIADSAVGLLAPYREELARLHGDLAEARTEAREARTEGREARRQMARARDEAQALADTVRRWRLAILRPGVSVDELRAMVTAEPGGNGAAANLR